MSENTVVNQPESGSAGAAPRRSRRAMREAERAAEREAYLTGQQPLLTRREMRRLRQEAEALQQALEAGEITPEQARALQDPLADQPVIQAPAHEATGHHTAPATPVDGVPAEQSPTATPATAETPAEPDLEAETPVEAEAPAEPDLEAETPVEAEAPAEPDLEAETPVEAEAPAEPDLEAETPVEAEAPADEAPTPLAEETEAVTQPEGAPSAQVPVVIPSPEAPATGQAAEDENAEITPATDEGADAAPAAGVPGAASPQVAGTRLTDAQMEEISALPTGVLEAVDAPIAAETTESAEPRPVPTRRSLRHRRASDDGRNAEEQLETAGTRQPSPAAVGGDGTDTGELPVQSAEQVAEQEQQDGAGTPSEEAEAAAPTRRPIVRIPAAAQGVRTVDTDTGELSAVQPVIQPDAALQVSQQSGSDLREETDGIDDTEAQPDAVEIYDGIDNPQWPSLDAAESAASDDAVETVAATTPAAAVEDTDERVAAAPGKAQGGSGPGRILLVILLAVVLALVVLAVLWYLDNSGAISIFSQSTEAIETWTRLVI
ncbi:hypothetical protein SAMN05216355_10511 [Actinomyces ruminicola]|uniref:Uncharacterized protein n=1 Tax=Actinomyces ruminicola TaxID=332524 RepID=A0A1H0BUB4_9ACTO|nr:hypothetical protein [Actinomyces ruminicola]SDN49195.1 hypothetical protein SAMN05216355_10511 [Actinomyces ruminicola]